MRQKLLDYNRAVYFIMGSQNVSTNPLLVLEGALQAGIDLFQYREKGTGAKSGIERIKLGEELQTLCRTYDKPFIVNDDIELALLLGADGIHIGQDDSDLAEVKRLIPQNMIIGLSTSTIEEAVEAERVGVDYIGVGPIYSTTTKEDAKSAIGLEQLKEIRSKVKLPIVAIGGITSEVAPLVYEAGAEIIATISGMTEVEDYQKVIKQFKRKTF